MSETKPDLVLTFAHGYSWSDLNIFFNSLKKTGFTGDVVVFTSRLDSNTTRVMRESGVEVREVFIPLVKLRNVLLIPGWKPWKLLLSLIPYQGLRRAIGKRAFNIMCARFAHFHDYLQKNVACYGKVLITDIRDVCFQKNPFVAAADIPILSFLEPLRIKGGANGKWMEEAFGTELDPTLLDELVCCAGVTIGDAAAMLDYLTKMLSHLCSVKLMTPVAGVDQAVHNYLFHRRQLEGSTMMENGNPVCMTMGHGDPFSLGADDQVIADEKIVAILHQYDRNPELKKIIHKKFGQP